MWIRLFRINTCKNIIIPPLIDNRFHCQCAEWYRCRMSTFFTYDSRKPTHEWRHMLCLTLQHTIHHSRNVLVTFSPQHLLHRHLRRSISVNFHHYKIAKKKNVIHCDESNTRFVLGAERVEFDFRVVAVFFFFFLLLGN